RANLGSAHPEYKVPSAFVVLDAMPLSPNGKVDRKALPAPHATRDSHTYVAPRGPLEESIAQIWCEVLQIERVGAHDDVFDLGAHSLLATRAASRIRSRLGLEVALRDLFEARTVAGLAARIQGGGGGASGSAIVARPRDDAPSHAFPLSFAQERLWFLDQLEPGTAAYNMPAALRLSGCLDADALEQSIHEVVARHEALRTTFGVGPSGDPVQVIHASAHATLPRVSLVDFAPAERERRAREEAAREARAPFDLARGPLLRAKLLVLAAEEHLLLFTMHHIVSDGWSIAVLVREIASLYAAFTQGRPSPLPALAIHYADYAAWQRESLSGDELDRQVLYWKSLLAGAPAALELPTDRPRPPVQSFRGALVRHRFSAALKQEVIELGRREGTTPFMTLFTGFNVLLSRYAGQSDIVVGTPVANRTRTETEGLIGFFVNTLAIRSQVTGTFRQLLVATKERMLGAFAHQDTPFERVVEAVRPVRDRSRTPLFQVMFILHNQPSQGLELPGLRTTSIELDSGAANFDVLLNVTEDGDELEASFEYNTDLFDRETIERMARHLGKLLESAAHAPDAPVSRLALLGEEERRRALEDWNATARRDDVADETLEQLFAQRVRSTPELVAVEEAGVRLTYRELDEQASRVASALRALGVVNESRVGIFLERSMRSVVAVLGTLKAGAVYVPLDPSYPSERLTFMMEDARLDAVVTRSGLEARLADGLPRVAIDRPLPSGAPFPIVVTPASAAYVIYTSGSTGKPKGVVGLHGATVNRVRWMWTNLPFQVDEVACMRTSLNFVDSVWELFGPLLAGVRSVIVPDEVVKDPTTLVDTLAATGVTRIVVVPSLLDAILESCPNLGARWPSLRHVTSSGEALSAALAKRFLASAPGVALLNLYGSSEVAADATFFVVGDDVGASVPLGRPIDNTQTYVLDAYLEPVPVGVQGELYVGGAQIARGYWARPDLTADRFVPDPFATTPGARMYRTGDRVRHLPDGNIAFLGRVDHQVKVRGFRIELDEIEAQLLAFGRVSDAIVVTRATLRGEPHVVAYVIAADAKAPPSHAELRDYLKTKLPEYMVPSAFVLLDALPLTPNGKVDRNALPAPDVLAAASEYVAPRDPTEAALARIWCDVLRVPRVGVHDDFFALGGHSLLATRVVSRIRSELQVELALRELFEATTVEQLAARITRGAGQRALAAIPRRARTDAPLALSFAQERLWFLDQLEPGNAAYNIPGALRLSGRIDATALERAIAEVVRRHEALRTTFDVSPSGDVAQVIHLDARVPLTRVDVHGLAMAAREERARSEAVREASTPFDLKAGPLLRATLLELADDDHVLLFTLHHIVADGWSLGALVREVTALYAAFVAGAPSPLADLPIQYADYAAWQRAWLRGDELERQTDYWQKQMAGAPASLSLPTDRPRPALQTFAGASLHTRLARELSVRLDGLGRTLGATPFMVLLAAFDVLLHRYSGQRDVVVGTPIANRTRVETEGLIGIFINTLALRADVRADLRFVELVAQTKATTLGAYAHQDLPFEKLVEVLGVARDMSTSPVFQVMFVLQNAPDAVLELAGLTLRHVEASASVAKFDLTLFVTPHDDGYTLQWEYNTDLFDAATIDRVAAHFETLLESIAAAPEQKVSALPLLSPPEQHQLLVTWNATGAEYARDETLHGRIEQQARATPDAVAVECDGRAWSYRELDERGNRLAHHLRLRGVGPEVPVGICVERSLEMVVALLGVLKAGGAYVPLDPAFPRERLAYMLADSGAPLLLTQKSLLATLPDHSGLVVLLDGDAAEIALHGAEPPSRSARAASLCYVLYTSGSTGWPKGVQITHQSVLNFLSSMARAPGLDRGDALLAVTTLSFDIAGLELYLPLITGAKLVLADKATASDGAMLQKALARGITALQATPATYRMLLDAGWRGDPSLKLLCGGEALPRSLLAELAPRSSGVWNMYGPTETTIWSTCALLRDPEALITMGRPIANTRVYVLSGEMQPVPIGVAGELFIAGDGVARGYRHRPDLTAERF
ncbi:MAG: pcbAB, partial [Myxococcaceae bacterium]|nr:pcbAB [Myxococcaceae bacterium]